VIPQRVDRPTLVYSFAVGGRRRRPRVTCRTCLAVVADATEHAVWHAENGHAPAYRGYLGERDSYRVELHTTPNPPTPTEGT
jgi:hypothetical protein